MEEGLRFAGLVAVVGEAIRISLTMSWRLRLCVGIRSFPDFFIEIYLDW